MQYANPNAFMDNSAMPPQYGAPQQGFAAPQQAYGGYEDLSSNGARQFFEAGDFNRSGFLDVSGLQTALNAAGEQVDFDTAQTLMQTADQDGNGRVDFGGEPFETVCAWNWKPLEFVDLLDSVREVKSSYNGGSDGMSSRDIESYVSTKWVFIPLRTKNFFPTVHSGDQTERGLLPTFLPTNQKFFTFGNFIKLAFVVGIGRKIYDRNHKKRLQNGTAGQGINLFGHNIGGSKPAQGYAGAPYGAQPGYGGRDYAGAPGENFQSKRIWLTRAGYQPSPYGAAPYAQPGYGAPVPQYGAPGPQYGYPAY